MGHRCDSDPELLWLWHRLEAVAPIQTLAWELSYAVGAALKRKKKKGELNLNNILIYLSMSNI